MALTVYDRNLGPKNTTLGGLLVVVKDVTFDSSYVTGGESLTASMLGFTTVKSVVAPAAGGYVFEYDYVNSKLLAYYADYDAGADGALIQVAGAVDLSAVVTRILAVGV